MPYYLCRNKGETDDTKWTVIDHPSGNACERVAQNYVKRLYGRYPSMYAATEVEVRQIDQRDWLHYQVLAIPASGLVWYAKLIPGVQPKSETLPNQAQERKPVATYTCRLKGETDESAYWTCSRNNGQGETWDEPTAAEAYVVYRFGKASPTFQHVVVEVALAGTTVWTPFDVRSERVATHTYYARRQSQNEWQVTSTYLCGTPTVPTPEKCSSNPRVPFDVNKATQAEVVAYCQGTEAGESLSRLLKDCPYSIAAPFTPHVAALSAAWEAGFRQGRKEFLARHQVK